MSDIVIESIRAFIMALIIVYLIWIGKREALHLQKGWLPILSGFILVFLGSLIDITDNFESLNRYVVIGDTDTEALLEKVGGFLLGFTLILVGFLQWLPLVASVRKNREDLLKYNEELGTQVAVRTADLTRTNERLLEEISARENLAKFPSEDPNPVLRLALDGTILYANAASNPVLDSWQREVGDRAPEEWCESVSGVLRANTSREIETRVAERVISFILAPINEADYANLYGRDVTEIKEIDRMKDNFLSMVSHELRTPLTGIKSSSEILHVYDDIDKESRDEFIAIINSECDRLIRLVNDLLDMSRIESGEEQWHMGEVSISEVFDTAINAAQTLISQKGLALHRDDGKTLPLVWSDQDKLVQVMTNLLSNAIKFTPVDGKIEVNARLVEESEDRATSPSIRISVSDTGIGISPDDCQEVFKKFKQVGENQFERPKGTGLGLPICNEIVQSLGGSMSVESELGKGSTFSFTVVSKR